MSRYARDESEGKVGILDRWTRSVARLQAAEVVRYFESLAQARRMLLASNHHSRVGSQPRLVLCRAGAVPGGFMELLEFLVQAIQIGADRR